MSDYARGEAAQRAGVDEAFVDRLLELGVIEPRPDGRLTAGDVRRVQLVRTLEQAASRWTDLRRRCGGITSTRARRPDVGPARIGLGLGWALAAVGVTPVLAHGGGPLPEPTLANVLTTWSGEALPWIAIVVAAVGYLIAVRIVNRDHPRAPVPRWRVAAWLAGVAGIGIALVSAVDVYATSLFSVHMVQHLLLAMVAPPLLALGAPTTLLLRLSTPGMRRTLLLPILRSRLVQAISWPPLGWTLFVVVMWATHFSPLFNAALEDPLLHSFEHLLYLVAGLVFWWPVIGADPLRWRLRPVARMIYLGAQMPLNTAVGLAIYFAPTILYAHYATLGRRWGPDPITDQQVAGIVMWGAGDTILLGALVLAVAAWLGAEERASRRAEERDRRGEAASAESR